MVFSIELKDKVRYTNVATHKDEVSALSFLITKYYKSISFYLDVVLITNHFGKIFTSDQKQSDCSIKKWGFFLMKIWVKMY